MDVLSQEERRVKENRSGCGASDHLELLIQETYEKTNREGMIAENHNIERCFHTCRDSSMHKRISSMHNKKIPYRAYTEHEADTNRKDNAIQVADVLYFLGV